ncbi:MAG: hypothetical protein M3299_09925 [Thermoproteota archaeon]|nr:hypothetical protein [Thermoproteota archaeon]
MQEESNEERKEKGESLSGGESSAEYIISKSEKGTQVPNSAKRISPTTDTKNPTIESRNVEIKERGESLPGGESSAEYMTSQAGEGEEELRRKDETEKDKESMGDKIKAGAKALKKKGGDPDRDLSTEYEKEKVK